MEFEWDEAKERANIGKHGIGFERVKWIFDGPTLTEEDMRFDYGERRFLTIGLLEGVAILAVVHTDRAGRLRLISARPASRREKRRYENALSARTDGI